MESHDQKIKDILKRNMTLTEAVKSILLLHRGKVNEMPHREINHTFKTAYLLGDDDVVKDDIVKNITPYAAGILIAELEKARFSTSKNNKMCSCSLKKTMLLPCRHVFARRIEQGENIFNIDDVAERWHLSYQKKIWTSRRHKRTNTETPESSQHLRKKFKKNPLSKTQKFKEMMVLCKAIADYASTLGTKEFNEKMDTLATMYDAWLSGEKVIFKAEEADEPYPCVTPETPIISAPSPSKINNMVPSPKTSESVEDLPSSPCSLPPLSPESSPLLSKNNNMVPSLQTNESVEDLPSSPCSLPSLSPESSLSNDNMVPSPCTSESFQDWPSSLASLQSLSPTPLQDNPRELTPMPSSPFSFESNTPEKSTTPVPSPAGFKKDTSRTSTCSTGRATKILKDLKTIKLPKTPPVRGNVRLQKGKENVFQSRKRLLEKKRLNKKETNNESRHSKTNTSRSDEIDMIGDPKEMLTDVHINAAQKLLTQQFPKMHGLQDTILGSKLQFAIETGDFIQILHDGALHWLTISNLFCNDNCVDIFDSLYTSVSMDVKMQAACIMMIQEQTMGINVINCKRQKGGYDCGLFSIAYATDLCFGNDPSMKTYTQKSMRSHLLSCLAENQMCPFPSEERNMQKRVTKSFKIPLFCICRLPDNREEKMGKCEECKEWFHKSCLSIPKKVFEEVNSKWYCTKCKKK